MDVTAPFREAMPGDISSYDPTGDLSTYEYCMVELDTTRNRAVKAFAGGSGVGILTNRPVQTATQTQFSLVAQVQWKGKALWKAGSAGINPGDKIKAGTGGVADVSTLADGDIIYGECEVGAAAGLPGTVRLYNSPVFVSAPE